MTTELFVLLFRSSADQVMFHLLAVRLEIDKLFVIVNELLCIKLFAHKRTVTLNSDQNTSAMTSVLLADPPPPPSLR